MRDFLSEFECQLCKEPGKEIRFFQRLTAVLCGACRDKADAALDNDPAMAEARGIRIEVEIAIQRCDVDAAKNAEARLTAIYPRLVEAARTWLASQPVKARPA